jgi:RNA polymerase sigma-70 factor (subfamily 1)
MSSHEGKAPSSVSQIALLGKVFEEHRARLREMIRWRIGTALAARVDPDDILHEAFLRAQDRWQSHDPAVLSTYAWLYRIALDALIAARRNANAAGRAIRREVPWPERSSIQLGLGLVGSTTSPSEALITKEQRERILWAVQQLKEPDREILAMHHFDELSYREAGAILGISEDAAAHRYARALGRLRRLWEKVEPRQDS